MERATTTEKKVNAQTLYRLFIETFKKNIKNVNPPTFKIHYTSLLKKLYIEQGKDVAQNYVIYFVENYPVIKQRFRIQGYPTISVLWGYRSSILEMMNEPRKNSIKYNPSTSAEASKGKKIRVETGEEPQTNNSRTTQKSVFLRG